MASPRKGRPGQLFPLLKQARRKKKQTPKQIMAAFRAMFGGPTDG